MDNRIQNSQIADLLTVRPPGTAAPPAAAQAIGGDFATLLDNQLKVSGHAQTRLQSRNIQLTPAEWSRVADGVNKAAAKGAKESLVMVDNVALVVSVKNRTVITAVDQSHLKDNVFTNIDSAVIV
ncbi:MAG: TIGR02530 family flagellar biosynthesis protein [Fimbriimonadaceae bacterium]